MFVASEEATSGSVIANAERISAFSSGCGQRLFCSGVPKYARTSMLPVSGAEQFSAARDLAAYRRAFGINVDGVFFGVNAALPALRARGRGALVLTSSLAGLTAVPGDPIYAATKHAVVGLARALGPALAADHIAVNALYPGFADTAINEPVQHLISAAGIPLMTADEVADALLAILASDRTGEAWYVQPGRPAEPFAFRNVPGPRAPTAPGSAESPGCLNCAAG
jgi:NAD(P)-dependent dehydrogenase (short-subunit alcohol dehydrogenase family)